LLVTDNGDGMDAPALASALSFGGSTRFGDRRSLGRYGMGLPNGGLSRARRIEVYSWRGETVLHSSLDIDELIARRRRSLPRVLLVDRPDFFPGTASGTAVLLRRCDRLEYRRLGALVNRLKLDLARIYRHYLGAGFVLRLNGTALRPNDPLMLTSSPADNRAAQFGSTLEYTLEGPAGSGTVQIVFSELPVEAWHSRTAEEKRRLGVTGAPSVSVVRANREVDRGWFFMGGKRRENYDDWWRCEVRFDPALDELFGITNSKQAIAPTSPLLAVLEPDLEPIARALNSRVRQRFEMLKVREPLGAAEAQAARAHFRLPPILCSNSKTDAGPTGPRMGASRGSLPPYEISVVELDSSEAFEVAVERSRLTLTLNVRHPLYRDLYGPLASSESPADRDTAKQIALVLLAAAHAESAAPTSDREALRGARAAWGDAVAAFFNA
jgi:hypothetical protein